MSADRCEILRQALGLDWLRPVDPPRWVTAREPDHIEHGADLGREHYSPEFRWSVGGRTYGYAVPVKTRQRVISIPFRRPLVVAEIDPLPMWDDLVSAIKSTCSESASAK